MYHKSAISTEFSFFFLSLSIECTVRHVCACNAHGVEKLAWEENEKVHAPTICLRCLDNAKCCPILHAPTRVLEFRFAINFRARLLRKAFKVDLRPQGSDMMLLTDRERKELSHERGVSHSTCEAIHGIGCETSERHRFQHHRP